MPTPVPDFPAYTFTRSGILRRRGHRLKPSRHWKEYQLWHEGTCRNITAAQLHALVFGTDPASHHDRARGERIHMAKLTADDVRKIRELAAQGLSSREIAAEIGKVRPRQIRFIVAGHCWRHV